MKRRKFTDGQILAIVRKDEPGRKVTDLVRDGQREPAGEVSTFGKGVCISHSSEDRELVEDVVVPSLHDVGLDTWYSKANIRASEQWERSIVRGLESCQWFVIAMTPAASLSPWVRSEVHWAVEHRWGRIVPLLLKDCNPLDFHLRMPELQYILPRS